MATKTDIIDRLCRQHTDLAAKDINSAVGIIVDSMADELAQEGRIEIRGFGSFSVRERKPRVGRNPKTGDQVNLETKYVPHFKPGKELRERVDAAAGNGKKTKAKS